ncbi:MAG: sulfatase [Planctomycetota bacterium]
MRVASRRYMLFNAIVLIALISTSPLATAQEVKRTSKKKQVDSQRPNILWLYQEDLSPWLGCYGYEIQQGHTPNLDAMAKRGIRFSRAYVPAPVCSICRSAIITGASQIRFGAHEHRSRRGEAELPLPDGMKTIVELMTESGYFCFNIGKTDYNFKHKGIYAHSENKDKTPWRACPDGKPFFGQIQLKGGKLNTTKFADKCDRAKVSIPADYPQNDLYRDVVAEHFDSARMDDGIIGQILSRLDEDGLTDSTIVVYFSDHGANNLVRHKQQPTEGGSHVPFIIAGPDRWVPAPSVRDDLVSMLDLSATTLTWAGVEQPAWMEGQSLFAEKFIPREFVPTARDRCDQTIDRIRSIRTDRFRYTRNYMLDRVLLQPQYRDKREFVQDLRTSYADGTLDPKLAQIYFGERPAEEMYDVKKDPAQINNLVNDPQFAEELKRHRKLMDGWLAKGDSGAGDEPEIELRMADNKKWGRGVNPEYEVIRKDSDGDGLSDDFETLNGRDANDGRLLANFDCGGWQTEGWTAEGKTDNLAGSQGFLEFTLLDGKVTLVRDGLNLDSKKQGEKFLYKIDTTGSAEVRLAINDRWQEVRKLKKDRKGVSWLRLTDLPKEPITSVKVQFVGEPGSVIVIDSMEFGDVYE